MQQIIKWGVGILNKRGAKVITSSEKIMTHPGSSVWKIKTDKGYYFLKYMTQDFAHELPVLEFLHDRNLRNLPNIIAKNDKNTAFLMEDAGNNFMPRSKPPEVSEMINILDFYSEIQIECIKHKESLLNLGVINLTAKQLPTLYARYFIDNNDFLIKIGASETEIRKLQDQQDVFNLLCKKLDLFNAQETLDQGDFNLTNIFKKEDKFTLCDFGDSAINNPFFSIYSLLCGLHLNYNIKFYTKESDLLVQHYFKKWSKFMVKEEIELLFYIVSVIHPFMIFFYTKRVELKDVTIDTQVLLGFKDIMLNQGIIPLIRNMENAAKALSI